MFIYGLKVSSGLFFHYFTGMFVVHWSYMPLSEAVTSYYQFHSILMFERWRLIALSLEGFRLMFLLVMEAFSHRYIFSGAVLSMFFFVEVLSMVVVLCMARQFPGGSHFYRRHMLLFILLLGNTFFCFGMYKM